MRGVLLDSRTGRPEPSRFEIDSHTGTPSISMREILDQRGRGDIADLIEQAKRSDLKAYTRNKHYIGGRTTVTAATARNVACSIWNPHSTSRIFLYEVWVFPTTAGSINLGIARLTARGTVTTSVTAAIDHSIERDTAAPSGFTLDLVYSVQPTVSASNNGVGITPAAIGNGLIVGFADPITIPAGTGIALITTQAVVFPVSDATFVVGD